MMDQGGKNKPFDKWNWGKNQSSKIRLDLNEKSIALRTFRRNIK